VEGGSQIKQLQKTEWGDMDKVLLKWFKQIRSENIWFSSPLLMDKTKELAKILNDKDFVCTNGWTNRFKFSCVKVGDEVWAVNCNN
jgi:hypothetical protein